MTGDALIDEFAQLHDLPESFCESARNVFWPLREQLRTKAQSGRFPVLVGIHGCQGSGKSTLTDFLLHSFERQPGIRAVGFSLDDFYLTRNERISLAQEVHPLLKTRGVPGTHDMSLLARVLDRLNSGQPVEIPKFNKALDDRASVDEWQVITHQPNIILFEGWCVGVPPQSEAALQTPCNALEADEDIDARWRHYANDQLRECYKEVFDRIDTLVMIRAPGFDAVLQWRQEQEERLVRKLTRLGQPTDAAMSRKDIERFVEHYQRLTEHALTRLPSIADVVIQLDYERQIQSTSGLETAL